jgi:hypothetical protein
MRRQASWSFDRARCSRLNDVGVGSDDGEFIFALLARMMRIEMTTADQPTIVFLAYVPGDNLWSSTESASFSTGLEALDMKQLQYRPNMSDDTRIAPHPTTLVVRYYSH